jgi:hypothetical protein
MYLNKCDSRDLYAASCISAHNGENYDLLDKNFFVFLRILWPLTSQEMALLAAITRLTINCSADSRIGGLEQLRRIRSIFQHTRVITLLPNVSLSRSSRRWRRCFAAAGNCVSRVYHQYRFDTGLVASTHNIHTQPAPG